MAQNPSPYLASHSWGAPTPVGTCLNNKPPALECQFPFRRNGTGSGCGQALCVRVHRGRARSGHILWGNCARPRTRPCTLRPSARGLGPAPSVHLPEDQALHPPSIWGQAS